jgi:hypothetical protein
MRRREALSSDQAIDLDREPNLRAQLRRIGNPRSANTSPEPRSMGMRLVSRSFASQKYEAKIVAELI